MYRVSVFLVGLVVLSSFAVLADEIKLTPQYLVGTWSLGGKDVCGRQDVEYVALRQNGTFEAGIFGTVDMVGFWQVVNDSVELHGLHKPNPSQTSLAFIGDRYSYAYAQAVIFIRDRDTMDFVTGVGDDMGKRTAYRCR